MRDIGMRGVLWSVVVFGGGLAVAVLVETDVEFYLVAGAYAAAHIALIPTPGGRSLTLAAGVAAAAAIIGDGSLTLTLGAAALGLPIGWAVVGLRHGTRAVTDRVPGQVAGLVVFSVSFWAGRTTLPVSPGDAATVNLGLLVVSSGLWHMTSAALRAWTSGARRRVSGRLLWRTSLEEWPAYLALFASGAIFALTLPVMGGWAVVLAGLPYAFSHVSMLRLATTRVTYDQTIRALGRVPEAGGYVSAGHAERSADLAVATAAELGVGRSTTRRIEYAALLHDIGRIVLNDPSIADSGYTQGDVTEWGAAIVSEARYLEPVAELVAELPQPYRSPGVARDHGVPVASQVVKVATTYDAAVVDGLDPVEALEKLHRGAAYDYDPVVVTALRRVLERRSIVPA